MAKVTPTRSFLLRIEEGKRIVAKRGVKMEVTDAEWKRFFNYFREPYPVKKKGLSAK